MTQTIETYRLGKAEERAAAKAAEEEARQNKSTMPERLVSLDAFRGFIMLMLAAGGFGIAALAKTPGDDPLWKILDRPTWQRLGFHFDHPVWGSNFLPGPTTDAREGSPWQRMALSFWDLIQPAFMFMVGMAMPFSYYRRRMQGETFRKQAGHAFKRALILTLMGVALYSINKPQTNWIFPNVLAQIGLGYFFAFLILRLPLWGQTAAFALVLFGHWCLFQQYAPPEDYDFMAVKADVSKGEVLEAPFRQWSKNGNAAHQFDLWLLNKLPRPQNDPFLFNAGGYQTLNFLSSIATALLGIFCTRLLTSRLKNGRKLFFLLLGGACCLALGLAAGASACPIIKRLWTPSWVLFSGAYVIWMLALFFLLIEILPFKRWAFPLTVLGMNSLAVYVLEETGREMIKQNIVRVHFKLPLERLLGWLAERTSLSRRLAVTSLSPEQYGADLYRMFAPGIEACGVLLVIWLCAYWLYKRQLFLRV